MGVSKSSTSEESCQLFKQSDKSRLDSLLLLQKHIKGSISWTESSTFPAPLLLLLIRRHRALKWGRQQHHSFRSVQGKAFWNAKCLIPLTNTWRVKRFEFAEPLLIHVLMRGNYTALDLPTSTSFGKTDSRTNGASRLWSQHSLYPFPLLVHFIFDAPWWLHSAFVLKQQR